MVGTRQPARRGRALAPLLAGTALAALGLVALIGSGALAPGVSPGTGSASCVEQYSLDTLGNRSFAFDGTVTGIAGDEVTFRLNQVFKGDTPGSVTLTAAGMTGTSITSAGGPNLAVGDRYLVAGDDHFVWACGFTQAYDPSVAAQWSAALAG